jgi:hypothetical protein
VAAAVKAVAGEMQVEADLAGGTLAAETLVQVIPEEGMPVAGIPVAGIPVVATPVVVVPKARLAVHRLEVGADVRQVKGRGPRTHRPVASSRVLGAATHLSSITRQGSVAPLKASRVRPGRHAPQFRWHPATQATRPNAVAGGGRTELVRIVQAKIARVRSEAGRIVTIRREIASSGTDRFATDRLAIIESLAH